MKHKAKEHRKMKEMKSMPKKSGMKMMSEKECDRMGRAMMKGKFKG